MKQEIDNEQFCSSFNRLLAEDLSNKIDKEIIKDIIENYGLES